MTTRTYTENTDVKVNRTESTEVDWSRPITVGRKSDQKNTKFDTIKRTWCH